MADLMFDFHSKDKPRGKFGNVTICWESHTCTVRGIQKKIFRPTRVHGFILPVSTNDRSDPPNGLCGLKTIKSKTVKGRDTHRFDVHRGHIMGLCLGGPDVPANIVPQWANFQANGEWRNYETLLCQEAMKRNKTAPTLYFDCLVTYKVTASYVRSCYPSHFKIECHEGRPDGPIVHPREPFNQKQDHTDDKVAGRKMDLADEETVGSDWEDEDDDEVKIQIPPIRSSTPTRPHLSQIVKQDCEDMYARMKADAEAGKHPSKDRLLPDDDSSDSDWEMGR